MKALEGSGRTAADFKVGDRVKFQTALGTIKAGVVTYALEAQGEFQVRADDRQLFRCHPLLMWAEKVK